MSVGRRGWGWAGSVAELLEVDRASLLRELHAHHEQLLGMPPSAQQERVWVEEVELLRDALCELLESRGVAAAWGAVLEYELPYEGGRRPDVILLADGRVLVLEFKSTGQRQQSYVDQVKAYARDLSEYHSATRGIPVTPIVVLTRSTAPPSLDGETYITSPRNLGAVLRDVSGDAEELDRQRWLEGAYAPLPTLIAAARRIFEHEPLPRIRRAESAHIPQTIELLEQLAEEARAEGRRNLILLDGVPGAGKTLAGLSLVYATGGLEADATFLSGNGPLVKVLQDALQSRVFVRDLHKFIGEYGLKERDPRHHVVVFDEAQRMWDRRYMSDKRGIEASEPDLLIRAGERLDRWAALVGLIGEGQEIYVGEEGGLGLWREALESSEEDWVVHCPPGVADTFDGYEVHEHELLSLDTPLRSRRADRLYEWIRLLLEGSLELAGQQARRVHGDGFPMWLTRDLDTAKRYARERYEDEPDPRYGLLVSSHADRRHERRGLDVTFMRMQQVNNRIGRWFNAPPDDPESCCQLEQALTEFQVQGLEIDLPLIVWGEDLIWEAGWRFHPKRRRAYVADPDQLLRNAYRVLLSRGRDGLVIVVPSEEVFDPTADALRAAGVEPLPEAAAILDQAAELRPRFNGGNGTG